MSRGLILILALAIAIAAILIPGPRPPVIGDGGEYMAQAFNFAGGNGPAIRAQDIPDIQRRLGEVDQRRGRWQIQRALTRGQGGGADFIHFWFYALLVAPVIKITDALAVSPTTAFTAVNLALLGLALWMALPRIGAFNSLLLFAGPVIWFVDKAHTEAFTFALLTTAFAALRDRPWWSMVAAGAAATQNPPISLVLAVIGAAALWRTPTAWRDRRLVAGAAAGLALALLHPVYTYWRHGTPSLLLEATKAGIPTAAEMSAVIFDPTLGIVGNYPLFLLVVAAAVLTVLWRSPRDLWSPELLAAVASAGVFIWSFAQTTNVHHGGTPSFSRYVIWLAPLSLPLLALAQTHGRFAWKAVSATTAVASAALSLMAFHPGVRENAREPTWLATWVWTRAPHWHNPLPEIFVETHLHAERFRAPITTERCEKILLAGRGADEGIWPIPCYPQAVPTWCSRPGALCYANLRGSQYEFVRAPGRRRLTRATPSREWIWPLETEPFVRRIYDGRGWSALGVQPELDILTEVHRVRFRVLGDARSFMLVLGSIGPEATLTFHPTSSAMTGAFVDPASGRTVQSVRFEGSAGDIWTLPVPQGSDFLLLTVRAER